MARTLVAGPIAFTASSGTTLETLGGWTRLHGNASYLATNTAGTALTATYTATEAVHQRSTETFAASQYAKATIGAFSWAGDTKQAGVIVQGSGSVGADSFYVWLAKDDAAVNRTTLLQKWVGGAIDSTFDTRTLTWTNGDTIELEFDSATATLYCYRNGTLVFSYVDPGTALSGGKPGLWLRGAAQVPTLDDWEGGDVVAASGPTIDTQPTAQTGSEGGTATFTVAATSSGGTMTRQWKRQAPGGGAFSNVGTDANTFTTAALDCATDHGAQFYCAVTDDNGTTNSDTVGLTVRSVSTTSRPSGDVGVTGWTASAGADFYALIDETSASDADYITSPTISVTEEPSTFLLQFPLDTGTWTTGFRAKTSAGTATMRVHLLNDGGTIVGSSADQEITATWTTYTQPITISGIATRGRVEVVL